MSYINTDKYAEKYSNTKTLRFNLLPVKHEIEKVSHDVYKKDLTQFIENYKTVVSNFSELVFSLDDEKTKILNNEIKIRISWLKTYTKQGFFNHENSLLPPEDKLVQRNKYGKKTNTFTLISKAPFLFDIFQNWISKNWSEQEIKIDDESDTVMTGIIKELEKLKESQGRNADTAYWVHQILRNSNFEFIYEFFKCIQGRDGDTLIYETVNILETCKKLLKNIEYYLLPSQSMGLVIERASLNYYTVNKKSKDYPGEIKDTYSKYDETFSIEKFLNIEQDITDKNLNNRKITKIEYDQKTAENKTNRALELSRLENLGFEKYANKSIYDFSLTELYKELKEYKALQKKLFFELESSGKSLETIMKEAPLFDYEEVKIRENGQLRIISIKDQFKDGFRLDSEVIRSKSDEYTNTRKQDLKTEITKLKKERGKKYFNVEQKSCPFPKYKIYCKLFKNVAMEYGKIKALVKSLEKEEVDATRLQSWAVILEKDNRHHIMTIPRDTQKLPYAYKELTQLDKNPLLSDWKLYIFESLTLRALDKLCFGTDNNTFIKDTEISNELRQKLPKVFDYSKGTYRLKRKDQLSPDGKELIEFYQKILSLDATKKMLLIEEYLPDIASKNSICTEKFNNLKDFQIALEKMCYIRKEIYISEEKKQEIEKKYNAHVYQITSYDLFDIRENEKEHTKIWKQFWNQDKKNKYPTRLNPQVSISYVEKRENSKKDKSENEVARNRRLQEEYILSTTISENNDSPKFDMAFSNKLKIIEHIKEFNSKINQKIDPYTVYYYGIDRGQAELLTLGLFKFENIDIPFINQTTNISGTYKKPIPVDIEVWELPKEKFFEPVPYKTKNGIKYTEAYKNISYADKAGLLTQKNIQSCMDLTSAKLVNGKIVTNGDLTTLIRLKIENAKRKIGEEIDSLIQVKTNQKGMLEAKITYREKSSKNPDRFVLNIDNSDIIKIYEISSSLLEYEKNLVQIELENYIKELLIIIKQQGYISVNIPIEKINHLRDAICANAVGILTFLQQKHFGPIVFEDLDEKLKREHFSQNNTNIGSRIEIVLLNKFKTLGLVPPNYKMAMSMQSKKEIDQLGIISYVRTEGTSSDCPHCGKGIDDLTRKDNKWKNHKYRCGNNGKSCGFSTYNGEDHKGLDFLISSDDVATYNIAKRRKIMTNNS